MPSTDSPADHSEAHIEEAKENFERYERFLADNRDIDWALIALFYSAVHLVQAHAERQTRTVRDPAGIPGDHASRNGYVSRQLSEIYEDYMFLQSASKDARYKRIKRSRQQVEDLHDRFYEPVRSHLATRNIRW
jgi:hypothetical protein